MKNINKGFTLAEVLITLVIIGVIAALTIPAMMANHRKEATASKLKKFFTTMTQAKNLWANEVGMNQNDIYFPDDAVNNAAKTLEFFNTYFAKNLSIIKTETSGSFIKVYLNDGTCFFSAIQSNRYMNYFYFTDASKCTSVKFDGKTSFMFQMNNIGFVASHHPSVNYTRSQLRDFCANPQTIDSGNENKRHMCTKLIQVDGWRIKDDYPVRI